MTFDFSTLDKLQRSHPAWRLLCADHAPLATSFLYRVFVAKNVREIGQADLAEALEDELYEVRQQHGDKFPKPALDYLNDWSQKGWLRKFYRHGSDEPQFDLTPATEKAISWLLSLTEKNFVGTESRLMTLFELLKQMCQGTEADPDLRIAELKRKRDDIDNEIARIAEGYVPMLDDTAIKDRFQQFTSIARELLSDFRQVEHNFRFLDRTVREKIARWEDGKGALLQEIMGQRDEISDSDQGKSFRAFWDFLMSSSRQDELTELLDKIMVLPAVAEMKPDPRTRRVHYDWLEAGEHTQRTVAQLSQQLRRFLDDSAWLENKRIMHLLHGIESKALDLRMDPPAGDIFDVDTAQINFDLPMERPLYTPSIKPKVISTLSEADTKDVDASALFALSVVNADELKKLIRKSLQERTQITLAELLERRPLEYGLEELIAYFHLGSTEFDTVINNEIQDIVHWQSETGVVRQALTPRVIFVR